MERQGAVGCWCPMLVPAALKGKKGRGQVGVDGRAGDVLGVVHLPEVPLLVGAFIKLMRWGCRQSGSGWNEHGHETELPCTRTRW